MTTTCDFAACDVFAVYPDDGWVFCWRHYLEHRHHEHGEPWPTRAHVLGTTLGTTAEIPSTVSVQDPGTPVLTGDLPPQPVDYAGRHSGAAA